MFVIIDVLTITEQQPSHTLYDLPSIEILLLMIHPASKLVYRIIHELYDMEMVKHMYGK
jgi:hypothetical protein